MLCYTEWSSCVFMVIIHNLLFSKCCCLCDLPLTYLPHTCQSAFQTAFRPPLIKGTEWVGGGEDSAQHNSVLWFQWPCPDVVIRPCQGTFV